MKQTRHPKGLYKPTYRETLSYTTQAGDTLRYLALRFYAGRKDVSPESAEERIRKANGSAFDEAGAIQAGAVLLLPNAGDMRETSVFWMDYRCHGCVLHPIGGRHRESTGKVKVTDATKERARKVGKVAEGKAVISHSDSVTMKDLFDLLESDYQANGLHSASELSARLKHLEPFFANRKAVSVSGADIRQYIVMRQNEKDKDGNPIKVANGTINRELAALSRAFTLGLQCEKIESKPYFPRLKESAPRAGFFEREQLDSVCNHLPEWISQPVRFCFLTGWRIGEVLSRKWAHVDFDEQSVCLEPGESKNSDGRVFYFLPELTELLSRQRVITDQAQRRLSRIIPYLFHDEEGNSLLDSHGKVIKPMREAWGNACNEAALPGKLFHDFRRTAVRNMIRAGIPERVAMKLSGHRTREIFDRYHIVSDGDLKEASAKLAALSEGRSKKGQSKAQ